MTWQKAMETAQQWSRMTGERYRVHGYRHPGHGRWRYGLYSTGRL